MHVAFSEVGLIHVFVTFEREIDFLFVEKVAGAEFVKRRSAAGRRGLDENALDDDRVAFVNHDHAAFDVLRNH